MHEPQQSPESFEAQQRFTERYLKGTIPWDTGISPPELWEAISGPHALPAGRALDIGCGTGTNSLTLAKHGWQVLGVDFAEPAIAQAIIKAENERGAIARVSGSIRYLCADVTCLEAPSIPYSRVFGLGWKSCSAGYSYWNDGRWDTNSGAQSPCGTGFTERAKCMLFCYHLFYQGANLYDRHRFHYTKLGSVSTRGKTALAGASALRYH